MLHTIGWLASLINAHTVIASAHRLTAVGSVGSFLALGDAPLRHCHYGVRWVPSGARLSRSR